MFCEKCREGLDSLAKRRGKEYPPPANTDGCIWLYRYDEPAKGGIMTLKNGVGKKFAIYSAQSIADKLGELDFSPDLITAVPMLKIKAWARGWNQAELIARKLGKAAGIKCDFSILKQHFSRQHQHSLNAKERAEFVGDLYSLRRKHTDVKGKNILICDDVITTGSTISKCAELLRSIGADHVAAVSICRTEIK